MRSRNSFCILLIVASSLTAQHEVSFRASLDSLQAQTSSRARGTGSFVLNESRTALVYQITVGGTFNSILAAQFHNAPPDSIGNTVRTISFTNYTATGVWSSTDATEPLTDFLVNELLVGKIYINVETNEYPAGEIRGTLIPMNGTGLAAALDGRQAGQATAARGTAWLELNNAQTELSFSVTVHGLTSTIIAAHFHVGPTGPSGPVVKDISFNNSTAEGVWRSSDSVQTMIPALVTDLLNDRMYINIHTTVFTSGEVRGQIGMGKGSIDRAGVHEGTPSPHFALFQNSPNPLNSSTAVSYRLSALSIVTLKVHDILGREVAALVDEEQPAGEFTVHWSADGFVSGLYFYTLHAGSFTETKKMILLK